jgi:hypothetical protein
MKRSALLVMLLMAMLLAPAASARETSSAHVERGFTLLELDPATAKALTDAGVRVSAVPPAGGSAATEGYKHTHDIIVISQ